MVTPGESFESKLQRPEGRKENRFFKPLEVFDFWLFKQTEAILREFSSAFSAGLKLNVTAKFQGKNPGVQTPGLEDCHAPIARRNECITREAIFKIARGRAV